MTISKNDSTIQSNPFSKKSTFIGENDSTCRSTFNLFVRVQEQIGFIYRRKDKKSHLENFQIEKHEDEIEEQEFETVDLEVVTSEEKSNKEDEKEVSNTKQKINDTLVAVKMNIQTVEELEANNKENVILEGFSSKVNSYEIGSLKMALNEIEWNVFFEFLADGEVHLLVAIFNFLSRFYPFDHNIFVQNLGGCFGHTPLRQMDFSFLDKLVTSLMLEGGMM